MKYFRSDDFPTVESPIKINLKWEKLSLAKLNSIFIFYSRLFLLTGIDNRIVPYPFCLKWFLYECKFNLWSKESQNDILFCFEFDWIIFRGLVRCPNFQVHARFLCNLHIEIHSPQQSISIIFRVKSLQDFERNKIIFLQFEISAIIFLTAVVFSDFAILPSLRTIVIQNGTRSRWLLEIMQA